MSKNIYMGPDGMRIEENGKPINESADAAGAIVGITFITLLFAAGVMWEVVLPVLGILWLLGHK